MAFSAADNGLRNQVAQELRDTYQFAKDAQQGGLRPNETCTLDEIWKEMATISIQKLQAKDYKQVLAAWDLPSEWLGADGSVQYMKLEHLQLLSNELLSIRTARDNFDLIFPN